MPADLLLVCALAIACVNKCGHSALAPVSFVNPMAQKQKALDIFYKLKAVDLEVL
jgi:hypothetical protein